MILENHLVHFFRTPSEYYINLVVIDNAKLCNVWNNTRSTLFFAYIFCVLGSAESNQNKVTSVQWENSHCWAHLIIIMFNLKFPASSEIILSLYQHFSHEPVAFYNVFTFRYFQYNFMFRNGFWKEDWLWHEKSAPKSLWLLKTSLNFYACVNSLKSITAKVIYTEAGFNSGIWFVSFQQYTRLYRIQLLINDVCIFVFCFLLDCKTESKVILYYLGQIEIYSSNNMHISVIKLGFVLWKSVFSCSVDITTIVHFVRFMWQIYSGINFQ